MGKLQLRTAFLILVLAATVVSCGIATYKYPSVKNARIVASIDDDNVEVFLDVYELERDCDRDDMGRVEVDKSRITTGFPVNQPLVLDAIFFRPGGFFTTPSSTHVETVFVAKPGFTYQINMSYKDHLYDFTIDSIRKGKKKRLRMISPESCRSK